VAFPELQSVSLQELPVALNLMQRQNPERHAQVMNHINAIQGTLNQANQLQQRQQALAAQQYQADWTRFSAEEDSKFIQRNPEMADPAQSQAIVNKAANYMRNIGFSDRDINALWHGQNSVSVRDHRVQQLIMDAMKYREARAAVPNAKAKIQAARVQKPGASGDRPSDQEAGLRHLNERLNTSHSARDAAKLLIARRAGGR
jgi:hypothetical protein